MEASPGSAPTSPPASNPPSPEPSMAGGDESPPGPGEGDAPMEGPERAFFGRRKGKRLRGGQEQRLAELLPKLRVSLPPDGARLDPAGLFPEQKRAYWLEI